MTNFRVEFRNISKSFGGILALDDVSLAAKAGEIHAIAGENGAGKSTLMKILAGALMRDSGDILIDGREVHFRDPADGIKGGIGIVYQELSLVPDLTVAENIFLHSMSRRKLLIHWSKIIAEAKTRIRELGFEIDPRRKVRDLTIAEQQIVEIARTLSRDARILILDEPTAVLPPGETEKLFFTLRHLAGQGISIFYISHRLEEIVRISDTVSVLKDGVLMASLKSSDTNQDELIKSMIGRKLENLFHERKKALGKEIFRIQNLSTASGIKNISFSLREGEVLGLGGLVGSGRTEVLRALFGADRRKEGELLFYDRKIREGSVTHAVRSGMGMVPEDRKQHGVINGLSVRQNISLASARFITGPLGLLRLKKEYERTDKLVKRLGIRTQGIDFPVFQLSGGNQQKVAFAKWLGRSCRLLLLDEPTRGIDVGAKHEIYGLIRELSDEGIGIILVSSEMIELMGLSDRILVLRRGRISGELERDKFSEEEILKLSIEMV